MAPTDNTGASAPLALVAEPDAITADWLTQALAHELAGGTVTSVEATPVGTGQVGDTYRLAMELDGASDSAPRTVVAKLPAADEASRATGVALRNYEVECRFYQQLAADLPIRTPSCHQALFDEETHDYILLFEDLAPAEQGDQIAGATVAEAELAVRELTNLHAPRFGDPTLASIDWLSRSNDESTAMVSMLSQSMLPGFLDRYGDRLDDGVAQLFTDFSGAVAPWLTNAPEPFTITHGDYRLDNMLYGTDADGQRTVAVVDFQGVAHGAGTNDLAYFVGAGLTVDARRANEEALVDIYHEAMVAGGVTDYDRDTCFLGYRRGALAGVLVTLVASMMVEQTERGDEMFVVMANRHGRHSLDLDSLSLS